nr:hypothetical protein [Caballeronia glathei]
MTEGARHGRTAQPGEKIQTSGIYNVVKEGDGGSGFEVEGEGEHFPPPRSGKDAHYELVHGATAAAKSRSFSDGANAVPSLVLIPPVL